MNNTHIYKHVYHMSTLVRQLDTSEDPFELLGDENSGLLL